jgi:microcompartment protein CcmL/EutN
MTRDTNVKLDATHETINALGFVEVRGLAATIETADSMLKSAEVRLLRQLLRDPAQTMITVEGSLGACQAAVDAGRACATRLGAFVGSEVMGRPAQDTADFVLSLAEAGRKPFGEMRPGARKAPEAAGTTGDSALLAALAGQPGGYGAQALARHAGCSVDEARQRLEALCGKGTLIKRRGRYILAEHDGGAK